MQSIQREAIASTIHADELTEGDIIKHFTDEKKAQNYLAMVTIGSIIVWL